MNNRLSIAMALLSAALMTSCYDDYVGDYEVVAAGFANATDVRTVVVGEGMNFSTGVFLGGTISNSKTRRIDYEVDYTLVSQDVLTAFSTHPFSYIQTLAAGMTSVKALPASQYTLSNYGGKAGQAVIRKGTHLGVIDVQIDSAAFLADETNLLPCNLLPLRLTDGNGTDLIDGYTTTVIGVRYENTLFGYWYHGGVTRIENASGVTVGTVSYPFTIPQTANKVWTLTTVSPHTLTANAIGSGLSGSDALLKLTLQDDGIVTVGSVEGSGYDVQPEGESRFNRASLLQDRQIYLSYRYTRDSLTYHATDTLTFRNRVRDGVNEWQDENQDKY